MSLWSNQKVNFVAVTGEYGSGKTMFGLTLAPVPPGKTTRTLVFSMEDGVDNYAAMMAIDIVDLNVRGNNEKSDQKAAIQHFINTMSDIEPGQYDVIIIDNLGKWETCAKRYYDDLSDEDVITKGLKFTFQWSEFKKWEGSVLSALAGLCETFVVTSHLGDEYENERKTGKLKPKWKDIVLELADLVLFMQKGKNNIPGAYVIKSRLTHALFNDGEMELSPALPPYLPVATIKEIRSLLEKPRKFTKAELNNHDPFSRKLTPDEVLELQVTKAQAEENIKQAERETQLRQAKQQLIARLSEDHDRQTVLSICVRVADIVKYEDNPELFEQTVMSELSDGETG